MCGLDDGIQDFRGDRVSLIVAVAAMSLQQTDGLIHAFSSILLAVAWLQSHSSYLPTRAIASFAVLTAG